VEGGDGQMKYESALSALVVFILVTMANVIVSFFLPESLFWLLLGSWGTFLVVGCFLFVKNRKQQSSKEAMAN
jgi:hypothetical protein